MSIVRPINSCSKPKWTRLSKKRQRTQQYAAYKRITLALTTHMVWKWRDGKTVHANGNQKRTEAAILTSYKIEFQSKSATSNKNKKSLYSGKATNSSRGHNNCKYNASYWENVNIKANINRNEKRSSNTGIIGDVNTALSTLDR